MEPHIPQPTTEASTTTEVPTVPELTTKVPHVPEPTTEVPHVPEPTTEVPHIPEPTTEVPHVPEPTTMEPHIPQPTTEASTTTEVPTVPELTTEVPHVPEPTTEVPHVPEPTTMEPHIPQPTTEASTTTEVPTVPELTTEVPHVPEPTTIAPHIPEPTTEEPHIPESTTEEPHVSEPTTMEPNIPEPTTEEPHVPEPTTEVPTIPEPTTMEPHVPQPTTEVPTIPEPTTMVPHVPESTTEVPNGLGDGVNNDGGDFEINISGEEPEPTTEEPHVPEPTTMEPHVPEPTTEIPHIPEQTTNLPHIPEPTTMVPHASEPTTEVPHVPEPTTEIPHVPDDVPHIPQPITELPHFPEPTTIIVPHVPDPTTEVPHVPHPTTEIMQSDESNEFDSHQSAESESQESESQESESHESDSNESESVELSDKRDILISITGEDCSNRRTDTTDVVNLEGTNTQCQISKFPYKNSNMVGHLLFDTYPYVCGGRVHEDECHVYANGAWHSAPPMNVERSRAESTFVPYINGWLVAAGDDSRSSTEILKHTRGGSFFWTDGPSFPTRLVDDCVIQINDTYTFVHGYIGSGVYHTSLFDWETKEWGGRCSPKHIKSASCTYLPETCQVMIMGTTPTSRDEKVAFYDVCRGRWSTSKTNVPSNPSSYPELIKYHNRVIMFGTSSCPTMYSYDFAYDKWYLLKDKTINKRRGMVSFLISEEMCATLNDQNDVVGKRLVDKLVPKPVISGGY